MNVRTMDHPETVLLILTILAVAPVRGQVPSSDVNSGSTTPAAESGEGGSSSSDSAGTVKSLTIMLRNGTEGAEGVSGVERGIVVDRRHLRSATSSGGQSSLREMITRHGHQFSVRDGQASVDLSSTSISTPVIIIAYKNGIYMEKFEGKEQMNVTMNVYESTSSKDALRVQGHHIPMQYRDNKLVVDEVITVQNTGNRTYADPERARSFATQVPDNAQNVRTSAEPARMTQSSSKTTFERRFSVMTISPGQTVQKRIRYELPVENGRVSFRRAIQYPTDSFFIAIPKNAVSEVQTDLTVQRNATSPSGRGNVVKITGTNLKPGRTVSVDLALTGSSDAGTSPTTDPSGNGRTTSSNMSLYLIGIGVLAGFSMVVSLSTLVYVYRTIREDVPGPSPAEAMDEEPVEMREFLLEEIARLDNELEDGNISEDYHRERRSRLKSRLMDLEGADS